jgi:endoglucanase
MRFVCSSCISSVGATLVAQEAAVVCNRSWTPINAVQYTKSLNPGWNLGNSLDAFPDEGSWNNPPVVASTFDYVKAAGFKSVRIPGKAVLMNLEACMSL